MIIIPLLYVAIIPYPTEVLTVLRFCAPICNPRLVSFHFPFPISADPLSSDFDLVHQKKNPFFPLENSRISLLLLLLIPLELRVVLLVFLIFQSTPLFLLSASSCGWRWSSFYIVSVVEPIFA
jgi:hypothetical protein